LPIENQEDLQIVSYKPGGFFTPHYDACDGKKDYCQRMDGSAGPRLFTYLIYLNDDFEGGETVFPKLNKSVKPKKGKCVIFQSTVSPPDSRIILEALHGGNPVTSGNKWICNKWIRNHTYNK
jgi:predicted 2-oxoglutarate/Fe(II)-dependent dioxygenase YbiX